VLGFMEMIGGVLVLGRVATPDVPANQAQTQMNLSIAHFHAFLAQVLVCYRELDLVQVAAFLWHRLPLYSFHGSNQVTSVT